MNGSQIQDILIGFGVCVVFILTMGFSSGNSSQNESPVTKRSAVAQQSSPR